MNSEAAMARDVVLKPNDAEMLRAIAQELNNRILRPWRRVGSNIGDARHETLGHRRSSEGKAPPHRGGKNLPESIFGKALDKADRQSNSDLQWRIGSNHRP